MATQATKDENKPLKVEILSKTYVKPQKPLGRKECQLVTFDLPYIAFYYNQKLLIYKGGVEEFEDIVEKLKDGLKVVLEEFHQLAGKLDKDDEGVFKVVYDDDMEGVEFISAASENTEAADLMDEEGTIKLKELVPYNGVLNLEGLQRPLLSIQITKLKDGLVMGCAFNHAILDGTSTWHFMSSWAQICTGSKSISVLPFLDRTQARNTRVKLDLTPPAQTNGDAKPPVAPPLREKIFKFSESAIDKIKAKVNANPPEGSAKPFSTFQSLSTHIWHAATRARQLKPEDYTVFTVFADCRKRVDPPMPESYFGNLIQAIFTVTAAGLLQANPPEFAAGMIQKAIVMHDAAAIEARNKEWESNPIIFQFKDAGVNCVAVGSSPRFKVYDVDFGFGKPESVRSGTNNRFDGMVYLYQGKDGGRSIDVEISLEASAMENLEKDKEFLFLE
ncbi:HXXXD-type acyl-transferase family protein [Artemisia annua]|uniref:HXXXD-type acyl-transferase family protein n=1 Tax=Artemisia annua TaxID=35608 RepID=A0A2U1MK89_ARTAN|nr:HXXXD-type acyl-transferase family protein [Artemisia annua]